MSSENLNLLKELHYTCCGNSFQQGCECGKKQSGGAQNTLYCPVCDKERNYTNKKEGDTCIKCNEGKLEKLY